MGAVDTTATAALSRIGLEVEGVTLQFAGLRALDDVSFSVPPGRLTALIGPNGAGKSSVINVISGIYRADRGRVSIGGRHFSQVPTQHLARLGIARTFQNLALFKGLTVLENLMVGRYLHGSTGIFRGMFYVPSTVREEEAQRERVELGRALVQDPRLVFLDEPMTGMSAEEKEDMSRFVLDVHETLGVTMLLIEHDMAVVMSIAEQVVVLDFGHCIADGTPDAVQRDDAVIEAYLGRGAAAE